MRAAIWIWHRLVMGTPKPHLGGRPRKLLEPIKRVHLHLPLSLLAEIDEEVEVVRATEEAERSGVVRKLLRLGLEVQRRRRA